MLTPSNAHDYLALHVHRSCHRPRFRSRDLSRQAFLPDLLRYLSLPINFVWDGNDVAVIPEIIGESVTKDRGERMLTIIPGLGHRAQFEAPTGINEPLIGRFNK